MSFLPKGDAATRVTINFPLAVTGDQSGATHNAILSGFIGKLKPMAKIKKFARGVTFGLVP